MKKGILLKPMLLLFALIAGSSSASWAQESVEIAKFDMSTTLSTDGWTCNADKQSTTYYKMYKDKIITSPSLTFSNYKNIKIKIKARKLGGPSNAEKVISVYQGQTTNVLASYDGPGGTTLVYSSELQITPSDGKITVACLGASTSRGCGISEVIITGEEISDDPSSAASFTNETPSMDIKDGFTYLQTVNTASGYNGTIKYSITANTADATIIESTGLVTVKKAGSVTVKANAAKVEGSWAASYATYTLTVNDTRTVTATTISTTGITNTEIQNGTAAGQLTASVTAGSSSVAGASVIWESSKPAIATIDEYGNITLVKNGKTTITASYAGSSDYKPSSATYELIVTNSALTTINLNKDLFGITTAGNNVDEQSTTVDGITITTGCTSSASSKTYYAADHIRFYADSYLILKAPNGYVITNVSLNRYNSDTWNPDKISATVGELSGSDPKLWEGFNEEITFEFSGQCRIESVDITLTSKTGTITLNAACNDDGIIYGTFYTDHAFVMHEDLVGNLVYVENGTLVLLEAYPGGSVVPANTALLIATADEFEVTKDYTIVYTNEEGDDWSALNMLKGTLTADEMTVGENCLFYRLTMHNADPANNLPGTIGFWWGAANGGAFKPGANKAYLAVPTGSAQSAIGFGFDDATTNIQNIERTINDNKFYTLDGRRVAEPTKGIYIINGKKVVIK